MSRFDLPVEESFLEESLGRLRLGFTGLRGSHTVVVVGVERWMRIGRFVFFGLGFFFWMEWSPSSALSAQRAFWRCEVSGLRFCSEFLSVVVKQCVYIFHPESGSRWTKEPRQI